MSYITWAIIIFIIIGIIGNFTEGKYSPAKEKKRYKNIRKKLSGIVSRPDNYVILDTETTGVTKNSEVIEIAILSLDGDILFDQRIMPKGRISAGASDVHGITRKMLKDCPAWPDINGQVTTILSGKTVIAYNSEFDIRLLKQTAGKWDCPIKTPNDVCMMLIYSEYIGKWNNYHENYKWHKLTQAARHFKINRSNAHSALADCVMTRKLLFKIIDSVQK